MSEGIKRNPDGTFAKGQSGNPRGRAPRAREVALLAIGKEILNAQTWRAVVNKAVLDALGKITAGGQVVDDPDSTAQGRNSARTWLRDTFIGKPTEYVSTDIAESIFEQFAAYSDEEIAAAIAALKRVTRDDDTAGDIAEGIAGEGIPG